MQVWLVWGTSSDCSSELLSVWRFKNNGAWRTKNDFQGNNQEWTSWRGDDFSQTRCGTRKLFQDPFICLMGWKETSYKKLLTCLCSSQTSAGREWNECHWSCGRRTAVCMRQKTQSREKLAGAITLAGQSANQWCSLWMLNETELHFRELVGNMFNIGAIWTCV